MSSRKFVGTLIILAVVSMAGILMPAPKAFSLLDDVAVTGVSVFNNIIAKNQTLNVTVTVENLGTNNADFTVDVYVSGTPAAPTQVVTGLVSGESVNLVFQWDTTTFALGDYTLSAIATFGPDEDTGNNTFEYGTVTVIFPGDVNLDHIVNMADIAAGALAYGSHNTFNGSPASPNWDPYADMNGDGKVELRDIALAAVNFMNSY